MFSAASLFNCDLSKWNTNQVKSMYGMFAAASSFNGNVSSWDTRRVTSMAWMFSYASAFNGDLSKWNTGKVTSMHGMFASAYIGNGTLHQYETSFNGDLSTWSTNQVSTFDKMFYYANSFNQTLCWGATTASTKQSIFVGSLGKLSTNSSCRQVGNSTMTDAILKYAAYQWVKNKTFAIATYGDISMWDTSRVTNMGNVFSIANPHLSDENRRW